MGSLDLPPWLEVISGSAPVALIAPHGGRRTPTSEIEVRTPRKANDLFTAELTAELARRTRAHALINPIEDRNHLDLNRTSDVRRRATWILDWMLAEAKRQIERRGGAAFFFIHGWNAIQPSCDVGVGGRIHDGQVALVKQGRLTVPATFLPHLFAFAERTAAGGIEVTFGDRYPGAGSDNVLQLLSPRFAGDSDPRVAELAELAAAGRLAAVQLELAVPLRWPGDTRERLLEGVVRLIDDVASGRPAAPAAAGGPERSGATPPARIALELHDGRAGCGIFTALERAPSGRRQGRFLLCLADGGLVLFTGEDRRARRDELACMGLCYRVESEADAVLQYRGPALRFPRSDPFLDLEAGLAEAELVELEAELAWRRLPVARARGLDGVLPPLGSVEGRLRVGAERLAVSAPAVLQDGLPPGTGGAWQERRQLRLALGDGRFLSLLAHHGEEERFEGALVAGGVAEPLLSGRSDLLLAADGLSPEAWRVEVVSRSGSLRVLGQVTSKVPVVRPGREGKVLTHFGLARFGRGAETGFATFEVSRRLDASSAAQDLAPPDEQEEEAP